MPREEWLRIVEEETGGGARCPRCGLLPNEEGAGEVPSRVAELCERLRKQRVSYRVICRDCNKVLTTLACLYWDHEQAPPSEEIVA